MAVLGAAVDDGSENDESTANFCFSLSFFLSGSAGALFKNTLASRVMVDGIRHAKSQRWMMSTHRGETVVAYGYTVPHPSLCGLDQGHQPPSLHFDATFPMPSEGRAFIPGWRLASGFVPRPECDATKKNIDWCGARQPAFRN